MKNLYYFGQWILKFIIIIIKNFIKIRLLTLVKVAVIKESLICFVLSIIFAILLIAVSPLNYQYGLFLLAMKIQIFILGVAYILFNCFSLTGAEKNYIKQKEEYFLENKALLDFLNIHLKYGEMVSVNLKNIFIRLIRRIDNLQEIINGKIIKLISYANRIELLQSIKKDLLLIENIDIFCNNSSRIFLKELIDDTVNLNSYTAGAKQINIFINYINKPVSIKINGFVLVRVLSAILYHLILEAPKKSNITIGFLLKDAVNTGSFKDSNDFKSSKDSKDSADFLNISNILNSLNSENPLKAVTFRDNGYGYKFNKRIMRSNYFDIRAVKWGDIENLAKSINAKVKVRNVPYRGNVVEVLFD